MELEKLFNAHLADLRSIHTIEEDIFICPICFDGFTRDELKNNSLSVGHVWPDYIRHKSGSKLAAGQHVLLCQKCNNTAGSRGDKHVQLIEKIWDGDKTGKLYGKRNVELIDKRGNLRSLLRNSEVRKDQDDSVIITWKIDQEGKFLGNRPQDQAAFLELINRKEPLTFTVHPPHELKPELPPVGWITSAYLMAFYCFGYRYILHNMLDPVRDYIHKSFEKNTTELRIPNPEIFAIGKYKDKSISDPMVFLAVPLDGETNINLQIIFLNYVTRLPFHFDPNGFGSLFSYAISQSGIKEKPSELLGRKETIFIQLKVDKPYSPQSILNTLFGKAKVKD
jgi:hypothetical protein